jgi:hypothetical protein
LLARSWEELIIYECTRVLVCSRRISDVIFGEGGDVRSMSIFNGSE